eukprot:UC4_evm1s812
MMGLYFGPSPTKVLAVSPYPSIEPHSRQLRPPTLTRLKTGATKPRGWLERELTLQAEGISGKLPYFWTYFNKSAWMDTGKNEPHQFIPYYNIALLREKYVSYILDNQNIPSVNNSAWLGPDIPAVKSTTQAHNYWSKYLAIEAFESYAEATNAKQADKVIHALVAHHRQFYAQLKAGLPTLESSRWGFARSEDGLVGIEWLIDNAPDKEDTSFLYDLLEILKTGTDSIMSSIDHSWEDYFVNGDPFKFKGRPFENKDDTDDPTGTVHLLRHGVDIGQAMKTGPLWWRYTGKTSDFQNAVEALAWADKFLPMSDGMYWADENVRGETTPSRGTETCSVVETMFSLRTSFEITGNIRLMDRLERIAFNALPAALWPDITANVYHHKSNQLECGGQYAFNLFFCCTANVHQGWPKFVFSSVYTKEETIVISGFAPTRSILPDGNQIDINTSYPFSDTVIVNVLRASNLSIRIPCWTEGAFIRIGSGRFQRVSSCIFFNVSTPDSTKIVIEFGASLIEDGGIEIHRGALTFALRPDSDVKEEIINSSFPTIKSRSVSIKEGTVWNYGLLLSSLQFHGGGDVPAVPFSTDDEPPVKITALARQVPSWTANGNPNPLPRSPLNSTEPLINITLVPYGSTNIRISVFPSLCEKGLNCPSPPPAPVLPPNAIAGMNEPYNDAIRGGLYMPNASACWHLCMKRNSEKVKPSCAVWTFIQSKPGTGKPWCWLKTKANPVPQSGYISAVCKEGTPFPCPLE